MDAANENLNLLNMTEQEKIIPAGENAETDNQPELMDESVQEAIKENEQEAVPEITDGEVITQTEKKKKVRTHASLAKNIVSLVFFTLSRVFGITASTLFLVRESLTTQSVSQSVKNMTLGDTGIGFWFGQQGQDVTLDEYMTDVFNSSGVVSVQQKDVKKFLDSAFVKNFVTDRLNGYISDFMYGTGEGSINVDEVMSLLGDNWAEVSVKLGIDNAKVKGKTQDDIRAEVLTGVYNRLVQDIHFGSFTLSKFRKEFPVIMNVASSLITYPAMLSMAAVAVLLWFIILFMNIRYCGGFRYIGRCMSLIGIVNLAAAGAMYVLPVVLNGIFGLGYDFYISFMSLQVMRALFAGIGFLVCGIIITFFGKMLRAVRKRILRRKLT